MRRCPPRRGAALLALSALLAFASLRGGASAFAQSLDFSRFGIEVTVPELIALENLNHAVRFDSEAAIHAAWRGSYDRIEVVDLASVENRYALFVNDAARRADISIRGTTNLVNAVFDLEFLKTRSPDLGIYLHTGFEKVAFALYADLRPRLPAGCTLRVTGHSLGAAEAIILGMLLTRDGFKVEKILASAPPKVTDAEGWSRFESLPLVRLAGPFDPVPYLPPHGLVYGHQPYIQGGKVLLLLDDRKFTVVDSSFFNHLPEALARAHADKQHLGAANHRQAAYMARLLPKIEGIEYVAPVEWDAWAKPTLR